MLYIAVGAAVLGHPVSASECAVLFGRLSVVFSGKYAGREWCGSAPFVAAVGSTAWSAGSRRRSMHSNAVLLGLAVVGCHCPFGQSCLVLTAFQTVRATRYLHTTAESAAGPRLRRPVNGCATFSWLTQAGPVV